MKQANIRSDGMGRYYISYGQTRDRKSYKTVANAVTAAKRLNLEVVGPLPIEGLTSVAHVAKFWQMASGQVVQLNMHEVVGGDEQAIEFRGTDAVDLANRWLPKMGFKPIRVTYNLLNPDRKPIVIDADTPSFLDVGSEAYHSM